MKHIKFVITLLCPMIMVALAESDHSEFEAEVMVELGKLAQKNLELEKELESMVKKFNMELEKELKTTKVELESIEEKLSAMQIDLTTKDPWTGSFMVPETGLWRFTFMAAGYAYDASGGYGNVYLKVDGSTAAATYFRVEQPDWYPMSINTLQQLEAGQSVTIEWKGGDSALLHSDSDKYIHWTGTYMQSGTVVPPTCEYTGQTFEYPGSCRKYWLCLADGSIDVYDCCPDVYVPDAEACLSEDLVIVDAVCHSEDVCA